MKKKKLHLKMNKDYLNKHYCLNKALELIEKGKIDMKPVPLAAEMFSHAVLYVIGNKMHWKWLLDHADPIDVEDGGDKLYRRIGYFIIWHLWPSNKK